MIRSVISALFMGSACLQGATPQTVDADYLAQLRGDASRQHPTTVAANLRTTAAGQDIGTVRLWDDPMAGLALMAAPRMMRADEGDIKMAIEQKLPKPGLYAAKLSKAEAMQRAEREKSRSSQLEVGAEAARLAVELALADDIISLQSEQISWLDEMVRNAGQLSLDPASTSVDTLRLESELARDSQTLESAKRTRESLAARLNLIIGRDPDASWPRLTLPATPPPVPVAHAEIARIPHANPLVRSLREMTAAVGAETRIADRARQPEVSVGVESAIYSGGDYRSTMVGVKVSLPWFNDRSYQAAVDASKTREEAAALDVESVRLQIADKVLSAATDAANAAAQARAYSGEILEKTRLASESLEASWISSKSPLTDLFESRRLLFSVRLESRRFIAMEFAALEELNLLVPASNSFQK